MRSLVVVLGTHRSGTSAISGALTILGGTPPNRLLPPSRNNPKGYFESPVVLELNDKLLADYGRTWRTVCPVFDDPSGPFSRTSRRDEIFNTLTEVFPPEGDFWVLKDPRLCVLWPIWQEALAVSDYALRILLPLRDPDAVARSLERREGWPYLRGVALWLRNVLDAERFSRGFPRSFVSTEAFMADPGLTIVNAAQKLDIVVARDQQAVDHDLANFINPVIFNAPGSVQGALSREATAVYDLLNRLTIDANNADVMNELDHARNRFHSMVYTLEELFDDMDCRRADSEAKHVDLENKHYENQRKIAELAIQVETAVKAQRTLELAAFKAARRAVKLEKRPQIAIRNLIRFRTLRLLARQEWLFGPTWRKRVQARAAKRDPKAPLTALKKTRLALDITALCQSQEIDKALELAHRASRPLFSKSYVRGIEAILTARKHGFSYASQLFDDLTADLASDQRNDLPNFLIKKGNKSKNGPIAAPKSSIITDDDLRSVVIYTSLFGNYDRLPPIVVDKSNLEFVCFTDQDITADGWKIEKNKPSGNDPNLSAKYYKLHPHKLFPDHAASLFVDANTLFLGKIDAFLGRWLLFNDLVMWSHPERDDYLDEAEAIILSAKDAPDRVCRQMAAYESANVPRHAGLYEASFIWRRHHVEEIRHLMEKWWEQINQYSKRDQTSLYYLLHTTGPTPRALPHSLGTSRDNILFSKLPHCPKPHSGRVSTRARQPKVFFLYDEKTRHAGSTVMRGVQLSAFLRARIGDEAEIHCTSDIRAARDGLVIITKRLLDRLSNAEMRLIHRRNIAVAADPIDAPIADDKLAECDLLLAASLSALKYFGNKASGIPIRLLSHHADPRIADIEPPTDCLRTGYFGEFENTIGRGEIDRLVDYHLVSTRMQENSWLTELCAYNAHFAVRRTREIDGFKPFTKGFTAAKCKSVVICERDQGDNLYYLGDDYPYFVSSTETSEIERFLLEMSEDFGGDRWNYALEIMQSVAHRSSEEWICTEFKAILRDVFG